MNDERRKFRRESAQTRKKALILATLDLVAENGVRGATVREIAERANVTQGLIRHYFSTKEELILAAYEHHMTEMTDQIAAVAEGGSARERLSAFVRASLQPPSTDPRAVALWAGFLSKVQHDPEMLEIHERTYAYFRDHLQTLIDAALREAGRPALPARLRQLAIAGNALIDGLWLEGGALPDAFADGELALIGQQGLGAIIGISLEQGAEQL